MRHSRDRRIWRLRASLGAKDLPDLGSEFSLTVKIPEHDRGAVS